MSKFSPRKSGSLKKKKHWSGRLHESVISRNQEGLFNVVIDGGADWGQFPCIGEVKQDKINYRSGKVHSDEILMEVNGKAVSGLTQQDVCTLIKQSSDPLSLKTVKAGQSITKDLRQYLGARFEKGSVDHELQQTIRDNLYTRTVPCTTRPPRSNETPGVEYNFLTVEQFMVLEKSGNLLESGLFDGNYYGTPKPPHDPPSPVLRRPTGIGMGVEDGNYPDGNYPGEVHRSYGFAQPPAVFYMPERRGQPPTGRGPMPRNWEIAYTPDGDKYYVDHNSATTHWLDPRLARTQKKNPLECADDELPYGWEAVDDVHYGVYFIDYLTNRTTYENPVHRARRLGTNDVWSFDPSGQEQPSAPPPPPPPPSIDGDDGTSPQDWQGTMPPGQNWQPHQWQQSDMPPPGQTASQKLGVEDEAWLESQLKGEVIRTVLKKTAAGFGFTIVGGDNPGEVMQVKSIVSHSVAAQSGQVRVGDILVRINGICVLMYTHVEAVKIFQDIRSGGSAHLELRRGYSLRTDTEPPHFIGAALQSTQSYGPGSSFTLPPNMPTNHREDMFNTLPSNQVRRDVPMPLPGMSQGGRAQQPHSDMMKPLQPNGQRMVVEVVKGPFGFGFTIADSPLGQTIKQILDSPRCEQLEEDDLLVEINGQSVQRATHSDVVNILKQSNKGAAVSFLIERVNKPPEHRNPHAQSGFEHNSHHPTLPNQLGRKWEPLPAPYHPSVAPPTAPIVPNMAVSTSGEPSRNQLTGGERHSSGNDVVVASDGAMYNMLTIELHRQVSGFGFRILGGREEGSQVTVGTIVPGGAADLDGRLQVGDEITDINNQSVMNETHRQVVSLMGSAGIKGHVILGIRRKVHRDGRAIVHTDGHNASLSPMSQQSESAMRDIVLERRPNEGFGFVLQSHVHESGCSICRLVPDSPAEMSKKLNIGDRIMAVDGHDVSGQPHSEVVTAIKRAGLRVSLRVAYPTADINGQPSGHHSPAGDQGWQQSHFTSSQQASPEPLTQGPTQHQRYTSDGSHGSSGHNQHHQSDGSTATDPAMPLYSQVRKGPNFASGESKREPPPTMPRPNNYRLQQGEVDQSHTAYHVQSQGGQQPWHEREGQVGHQQPWQDSQGQENHQQSWQDNEVQGSAPGYSEVRHSSGYGHEQPDRAPPADTGLRPEHTHTVPPLSGYEDVNHRGDTAAYYSSVAGGQEYNPQYPGNQAHPAYPDGFDQNQQYRGKQAHPTYPDGFQQNVIDQHAWSQQEDQAQPSHHDNYQAEEDQWVGPMVVEIILQRNHQGYGFSIRGGQEYRNSPLYVLRIAEGGAASIDGRLQAGDRILEINGVDTTDMRHADAIGIIKSGGDSLRLLVEKPPQMEGGQMS